ncbi:hypothetical protein FKM82_017535 [Ascaphus truei]
MTCRRKMSHRSSSSLELHQQMSPHTVYPKLTLKTEDSNCDPTLGESPAIVSLPSPGSHSRSEGSVTYGGSQRSSQSSRSSCISARE